MKRLKGFFLIIAGSVAISCQEGHVTVSPIVTTATTPTPTPTASPYCAGLDSSWTPSWSNLVGYWPLDELSGNSAADTSGKSNLGSISATGVSLGAAGKVNTGFEFTAANSGVITIPNNASSIGNLGNNLTVMAWIYPTITTGRMGIFSTRLQSNPAGSWQLEIEDTVCTGGCLAITGIFTYVAATGNNTIAANNWYHVAWTRNGTNNDALYINGVAQNLVTHNNYTINDNTDYKAIGAGTFASSQNFQGNIDEVSVWNTALSAAQILQIYNRQASGHSQSTCP